MLTEANLAPGKTYKTRENLDRALAKLTSGWNTPLRYHVAWTEDGRCYPIFIGRSAIDAGLFWKGFICIA